MNQTIDTVISELASRLAELVWTEAITQARDSLDTLGPKGVKPRKPRPAIDGGQRMEREGERTQRLGTGDGSGTPVNPVRLGRPINHASARQRLLREFEAGATPKTAKTKTSQASLRLTWHDFRHGVRAG